MRCVTRTAAAQLHSRSTASVSSGHEGEGYAPRLRGAGISVTTVCYVGIKRDFMMLNPLRDAGAMCAAVAHPP
jgi:acetyl esterase/lipase